MAANSVCGECQGMDEILRLSLLQTYCLPILTYAAPAIKLKACQLHELNCCWNSVYRNKVFGFHRWESVKSLYKWTWPPRLWTYMYYAVEEMSLAMQNTFHC